MGTARSILRERGDDIGWCRNLGGGTFGPREAVTTTLDGANAVAASDLDGDGLLDVVASGGIADEVRWYRNLGAGTFGTGSLVDGAADGVNSVATGDLDGDGLPEVLSAARALTGLRGTGTPWGTATATASPITRPRLRERGLRWR